VGLVADDVTGATDSAVQFAEAGWSAHLLRGPGCAPETPAPSLLAVVTGVRAAAAEVAAERTAAAVAELLAHGCERLYLKIDSTVRGSVAGQLRGALTAWAAAHPGAAALLCPAFPDQGRTVVGGQVLVDGIPVDRTAAAADPVMPVLDSRLERLVPGAAATTLADLDTDRDPEGRRRDDARIAIVDAATDADLAAVAACADRLGPAWVPAGSAGLAAAMTRRWSGGAPGARTAGPACMRILVGVSSLQRLRDVMAAAGPWGGPAVDVVTTPASRSARSSAARPTEPGSSPSPAASATTTP
jgi:uncharacterized protein YgbK (DUF1537 family)